MKSSSRFAITMWRIFRHELVRQNINNSFKRYWNIFIARIYEFPAIFENFKRGIKSPCDVNNSCQA